MAKIKISCAKNKICENFLVYGTWKALSFWDCLKRPHNFLVYSIYLESTQLCMAVLWNGFKRPHTPKCWLHLRFTAGDFHKRASKCIMHACMRALSCPLHFDAEGGYCRVGFPQLSSSNTLCICMLSRPVVDTPELFARTFDTHPLNREATCVAGISVRTKVKMSR